jgi:hypothetical protein
VYWLLRSKGLVGSKSEFYLEMDLTDLQVCTGFLSEEEWKFATKPSDKIEIKPMDFTKR